MTDGLFCVECGRAVKMAGDVPVGAVVTLRTGEDLRWCSPGCLEQTVLRSKGIGERVNTRRILHRLWSALENIVCELEAYADDPDDIRGLDGKELVELLEFSDHIESISKRLRESIALAETGAFREAKPPMGIIDSTEHPVLVALRERFRTYSDRAARIRRWLVRLLPN